MLKLISSVLFVALLSACTAMGPSFQSVSNRMPDTALVYFYHPIDAQFGGEEAHFLYYNDEKMLRLTHEGYTYFELTPGTHEFEIRLSALLWPSKDIAKSIKLDVQANQTYFVKYTEELGGVNFLESASFAQSMRVTQSSLIQVDDEVAMSEIATMKFIEHDLLAGIERN